MALFWNGFEAQTISIIFNVSNDWGLSVSWMVCPRSAHLFELVPSITKTIHFIFWELKTIENKCWVHLTSTWNSIVEPCIAFKCKFDLFLPNDENEWISIAAIKLIPKSGIQFVLNKVQTSTKKKQSTKTRYSQIELIWWQLATNRWIDRHTHTQRQVTRSTGCYWQITIKRFLLLLLWPFVDNFCVSIVFNGIQ